MKRIDIIILMIFTIFTYFKAEARQLCTPVVIKDSERSFHSEACFEVPDPPDISNMIELPNIPIPNMNEFFSPEIYDFKIPNEIVDIPDIPLMPDVTTPEISLPPNINDHLNNFDLTKLDFSQLEEYDKQPIDLEFFSYNKIISESDGLSRDSMTHMKALFSSLQHNSNNEFSQYKESIKKSNDITNKLKKIVQLSNLKNLNDGQSIPILGSDIVSIYREEYLGGLPENIEEVSTSHKINITSDKGKENLSSTYEKLQKLDTIVEQQVISKNYGLLLISLAEQEYQAGNANAGDFYASLASSFADIALGIDPFTGTARDLYEFSTGKNLITGESLSDVERIFAGVGFLTLGIGSKFLKASKLFSKIYDGGKRLVNNPIVEKNLKKALDLTQTFDIKTKENLRSFKDSAIRHLGNQNGSISLEKLYKSLKFYINPYDLTSTHKITMGKKAFRDFVNKVKKDGFIKEPIKYVEFNGKKYIVDGHHRVRAAKEAGIKDVPVEKIELPYKGYTNIEDLFY